MKKTLLVIILILGLIVTMVPPLFAAEDPTLGADASVNVSSEVKVGDGASTAELKGSAALEVKSTGLLPTSPFYFFKEWGRGLRKAFTFNSVAKAEYELQIAAEKASELERVREIAPQDTSAVRRAVENYQKSVKRVKSRLETLQETSANPKVDELLTKVTERAVAHQNVFEEIKAKHEELKPVVEAVQGVIDETVIAIPERFDNPDRFKERLGRALGVLDGAEVSPVGGLRAAIVIDRLEEKKPDFEPVQDLGSLKSEIFLKFEGAVKSGEIPKEAIVNHLEAIPDAATRLKIVDNIKETISTSELKNSLNALRPQLIKDVELKDAVSEEEARRMIEHAKGFVEELSRMVNSGEYANARAAVSHLEKAKFNLDDAEALLRGGKVGTAFGQANSAGAIAKAGISMLYRKGESFENEASELKTRLDKLITYVTERGITRESNPKVFSLFEMIEAHLRNITSIEMISLVKRLLAEAESIIRQGSSSGAQGDVVIRADGKAEVSGRILAVDAQVAADPSIRFKAKLTNGALISVAYAVESTFAANTGIKLSLDDGVVSAGAYFEARGTLNKEENTLYLRGEGDYLITRKQSGGSVEPSPAKPVTAFPVCTQEYAPVCGANGKTYPNACHAKSSGIEVQYEGECKREVIITVPAPPDNFKRKPITVTVPPAPESSDRSSFLRPSTLLQLPKTSAGASGQAGSNTSEAQYEFKIESDDNGFYPNSITVPKGARVKLHFIVKADNVYFGGQDFRSSKFKTSTVRPGGNTSVEFTADESFEFSSYWPASGTLKHKGKVVVE